ncbi:hypothetical protein KNO15_09660 [Leifsonia shinshuensis]|uniref:hypothetical protein n=1 Tax=Leifsonia shinshuensis TaxID=150026 RepID=UPI001F506623|nr:hypothetical protein [Leifsonia shinshuensis]MCI0156959.1 hypothetical protein [Leifsonia shinshuensis]
MSDKRDEQDAVTGHDPAIGPAGDPEGDDIGAEDVTGARTQDEPAAGSDGAEPPPADFDPAQQPSNPDLVANVEPPDE